MQRIDASRSANEIHTDLTADAMQIVKSLADRTIGTLWTRPGSAPNDVDYEACTETKNNSGENKSDVLVMSRSYSAV